MRSTEHDYCFIWFTTDLLITLFTDWSLLLMGNEQINLHFHSSPMSHCWN